jgi:TfoX/Sxy family transcriptional regulator of competence genes
MPKFTPAPEALVSQFNAIIKGLPEIEQRQMFGYPCAFIRGQMFVGVFHDRLMLRLSEADRKKFLQQKGAKLFEPVPGRVMKEYVELPPDVLTSASKLTEWLKRGLEYVQKLPPKAKKSKAAKKK